MYLIKKGLVIKEEYSTIGISSSQSDGTKASLLKSVTHLGQVLLRRRQPTSQCRQRRDAAPATRDDQASRQQGRVAPKPAFQPGRDSNRAPRRQEAADEEESQVGRERQDDGEGKTAILGSNPFMTYRNKHRLSSNFYFVPMSEHGPSDGLTLWFYCYTYYLWHTSYLKLSMVP